MVETYIQRIAHDAALGPVPSGDYYFLGKLDVSKGYNDDSFIARNSTAHKLWSAFATTAVVFRPREFAHMAVLDPGSFDRAHYDFRFVRREFLGDVRCVVVDVKPKKSAGHGRFAGRIWVEDQDYNIVRFDGTYVEPRGQRMSPHFDAWRVNCGPNLWLPARVYSEDAAPPSGLRIYSLAFTAETRFWGYQPASESDQEAFTNLTVDVPQGVEDKSDAAADTAPVEAVRAWEREAEENALDRLSQAALLAPRGPVDKVLDTVLQNLEITNKLDIQPEVRVRVLMTTPLESFCLGHTIVVSRGLLDVLPDEASLAAVIAHELGHIALGQPFSTQFAFADRLFFNDDELLRKMASAQKPGDEEAADKKALEILKKSPYAGKLPRVGLFLRALAERSPEMPHLIRPLLGDQVSNGVSEVRMEAIMKMSPALHLERTDEIEALPLGARIKVDPWTDQLQLMKTHAVTIQTAREKLPFEITPVMLHLRRENAGEAAVEDAASADRQVKPQAPPPTE